MADVERAMSTDIPFTAPLEPAKTPRKTAKRVVGKHPALAAPYGKKKKTAKKKRKAKAAKAAPVAKRARPSRNAVSLGLNDAIGLAASMHRTDVPVFQALVAALNDKGKPSRKRLLAALNKVFG